MDESRSTVTYYITSQSNHTAVVLYDSRNVSALENYLEASRGAQAAQRRAAGVGAGGVGQEKQQPAAV